MSGTSKTSKALAREARGHALGAAFAELEEDPEFAADVLKFAAISRGNRLWPILYDVTNAATKAKIVALDTIDPDLAAQWAYFTAVAPDSRAALNAMMLLLSKLPGNQLRTVFAQFESEAGSITRAEGWATESEDDDEDDGSVDYGSDDDDEGEVLPAIEATEAPAVEAVEAPAIDEGNETEDDDVIVIDDDDDEPAPEPVPVPEPVQALVPAGAEDGPPPELAMQTSKIQNVLRLADTLEAQHSTGKDSAQLRLCVGVLCGPDGATTEAQALAMGLALGSDSPDLLAALKAALEAPAPGLRATLHEEAKEAHAHALECLSIPDPDGFDTAGQIEFNKLVRGKVVQELIVVQTSIDIFERANSATPEEAIETQLAQLRMRLKSMAYQLSFVNEIIKGLCAPIPPMTVNAAFAVLGLRPGFTATPDALRDTRGAVEAAFRRVALSCHSDKTGKEGDDTKALCAAKYASLGVAKDVLFARIDLLEAELEAALEAELAFDQAEAGLKRTLEEMLEQPSECFGDNEEEQEAGEAGEAGEPAPKARRL